MNKLKTNQSGFGAFEGIVLLVVIVVIGVVGFTVYNNKKTTPVATQTTITPTKSATKPVADSTASWTPYASTTGNFSVKYPKTWATATKSELCSNTDQTGVFMLGANSDSVGTCATQNFGQMTITWRTDRSTCGDLNSDAWTQNSKQTVTVGGVSATKIEATAKAPGAGLGAEPEGTKTVQYCAVANNKTYVADYTQLSTYPDALSDFNLMVTKTLRFTN